MTVAPGPVIRPARPGDAMPIAAFDAMGGNRLEEIEAGQVCVVLAAGEVAGYATVVPAGLLGQPFLSYLCVRRASRRQGLARALLQAVLNQCSGRMLLTSTEAWCTEGRQLFEALGGRCVGQVNEVNRDGSAELFYRFDRPGASTPQVGTEASTAGGAPGNGNGNGNGNDTVVPANGTSAGALPLPTVHVVCGVAGLKALPAPPQVLVVVDVLTFTTCLDVACGRGAVVIPHAWREADPAPRAREQGAVLAGRRAEGGPSLSPASLSGLQAGDRLMLRTPQSALLGLTDAAPTVLAGCLRNAAAVAAAARRAGGAVAVLAAGEQRAKGPPRFALEDWLAAGALVHALGGHPDAAALAAKAAFLEARRHLAERLGDTPAGQELAQRGWPEDVAWAAELDVSRCVPRWADAAFRDAAAF